MAKESHFNGVPQFYKEPFPNKRRDLRLMHEKLVERLATSMSGSRDNELTKDKIAQVLLLLEKKWTPKDYVFLAIGVVGILASVAGFVL